MAGIALAQIDRNALPEVGLVLDKMQARMEALLPKIAPVPAPMKPSKLKQALTWLRTLFGLCLLLWAGGVQAQAVYVPAAKSPVTTIIAASNSSVAAKAAADIICTGTSDQTTINAAITALPSSGGKILFRAGQYNISGSIVIDRSYVDLEGEIHPHWGGYVHAWTSTASSVGLEGNDGSKIKATATGFNLISLANTNIPDGGESRHRGIRIARLYLFGNAYSSTGISGGSLADVSVIEDCFIQRVNIGMSVSFDTGILRNNDVQDCSGDGIVYAGYYGMISANLVYDIGGNGITTSADSTAITGNNIGDCVIGVYLNAALNVAVSGNTLRGAMTRAIATTGGSGHAISGNAICNGYLSNGTGGNGYLEGITIGLSAATSNVAITGNTFTSGITTSSYAIAWRNFSLNGVGIGNAILGNWNSGSTQTILFSALSALVATNAGDSATPIAAGPAAVTTASLVAWYKGSSFALSDGASVTTWADSSGAGHPVVPNTSSPTFVASGINSLPTVRFNGTSDALKNATLAPLGQPFTVFVVAKSSASGATRSIINSNTGTTDALYIDSTAHLSLFGGSGSITGSVASAANAHVLEMVVNSSSSLVGVDGTITTGNPGTNGWQSGIIMGANSILSAEWFNGDIAEVVVYSGAMSSGDRSTVRQALGTKYNITVTP